MLNISMTAAKGD